MSRTPLRVTTVHGQPVTMRDGTVLRADLYRPDDDATHRTVLVRSPYGERTARSLPIMPMLDAGLAVMFQHCRGRGDSDGTFAPWVHEGPDGADTVDWITAQPWSNGEVAATGVSYLAGCALQVAAARPGQVKAVAATMTPHDFYDGLTYHGGALALASAHYWSALQGLLGAVHAAGQGDASAYELIGAQFPLLADGAAAAEVPPLRDARVAGAFPFWREWVDHPERDAYWRELAESLPHDRITASVLHTAGWFDVFLKGTLENYRRIPGGGLVIGPWTHLTQDVSAGELLFGAAASAQMAMLEEIQIGRLAGRPDAGPPVRIFVMGANVWRDEEAWPPARAERQRFHLHPDGLLSREAPTADAAPTRFPHDPDRPVPTHGGPLLTPDPRNVGPRDQRANGPHPGVVTFTTAPLEHDVEVTGPVSATLHGTTTAAGADWTVKLVDVWPDGREMSVIDGILRSPAADHVHEVDLVATSQLFPAGHRIRVEIAGSNHPRFDLHPCLEPAEQTLFHDSARPSFITLPVIP
ncbi:CocE/NonD family hydrolase [Actinocorallia longicatena]|uniref:CocE/NonD family hydrolase n=1 Tax=Actinocorallia longicatena TaxID=111803 RepID=A0ABP6QJP3_9ACTN